MKPYVVTTTVETIIVADNKDSAETKALSAIPEIVQWEPSSIMDGTTARELFRGDDLPIGWTPQCNVYGLEAPTMSVSEAMAMARERESDE